ncbi:MAG: hypothetical protein RLZZ299_3 [Pseudomonadota bacterium]|jgi:hypothetical protein
MRDDTMGLTALSTPQLRTILRALHRAEIAAPLDIVALTRIGLQEPAEAVLRQLRGLDAAGTRAVLVCVLAERLRDAR